MSKENTHIIGMKIENLCNVHLVEANLQGRDLVVGGKNGGGKTTILRAVEAALRGSRACKILDPIREGQKNAKVTIDLGDLVVEKRFNKSGETLVVKNKDGFSAGKPQEVLKKLLGTISINPSGYTSMTDKEQLATLLEICPVDLDLVEHAVKFKTVFEARTEINRDIKNLTGQLSGFPEPEEGLPEQELQLVGLLQERQVAVENNNKIDQLSKDLIEIDQQGQVLKNEIDGLDSRLNGCDQTRDERKTRAKKLYEETLSGIDRDNECDRNAITSRQSEADAETEGLRVRYRDAKALLGKLETVDIEAFDKKIASSEETNSKIRSGQQWRQLQKNIGEKEKEAEGKTSELSSLEQVKADALSNANIPVAELSVGDGMVLYNGHPFREASHAQQVAAALQLLIAQDPGLKIINLQDASLMDEDTIAKVREIAKEKGYQLFCEFVANNEDQMALHITEGDAGLFLTEGKVTAAVGLEMPDAQEGPA